MIKEQKRQKGKKKSKYRAPTGQRKFLWERDYGNFLKKECICCLFNIISWDTAECGHIIAESKGGTNDGTNLRMICAYCNREMQTQNMDEFVRNVYGRDIKPWV